jgi:acetyl esterase/lipase
MNFMKINKKRVSYIFTLVIGRMVLTWDLPVIASSRASSPIFGIPDDCTKPVEVQATLNIAYDEPPAAGGTAHQLDIYHPRGLPNTIVLFFVHGGAFRQGDKNEHMELGITYAGYYNYTTVLVNYELSSAPYYAVHPDHIKDVARAFV